MITECKGEDNLIILGQSHIPANISTGVTMCAVEFAGVKFKVGNVSTGREYIQQVEMLLKRMLQQMPNIQKLIVSKESIVSLLISLRQALGHSGQVNFTKERQFTI